MTLGIWRLFSLRRVQAVLTIALLVIVAILPAMAAQNPQTPPPGTPPAGQRGGGRGGRPPILAMTLQTSAWIDGAAIPPRYAQVGRDVSPPLTWMNAPDPTVSFVLIVHDVDTPVGNGTDDLLQWMVWNIPGATHGLTEGWPQGPQQPDGSRQISATGPYYRGPGAPATGPAHHYLFEIFALDATVDVPAVGQAPPATRAAVLAAMAGHVRGKGTLVGTYRRAPVTGRSRPGRTR